MSGQMVKVAPRVYWAGQRFEKPGVWIWTGKTNRRIIAWPKRGHRG